MAHEYGKETLSLEFKSDLKRLPDDDLLDAVVALANSDGGTVYLGVEDDGTPTGLNKEHQDAVGLATMIANRTVPPVSARTQIVGTSEVPVMQIDVPKSRSVVSTKLGKVLRRRMKADSTPESVPMYPYEIATRLSDLGRLDFSAQPVPDATRDDFDPLERERLRRIIGTYQSSDRNLLELTDEELEQALQLTVTVDGKAMPTLTGLLLLGKEESLKRFVPTHRASFQVMSGTDIKVNQDYSGPLLKTIEQINDMFSPLESERRAIRRAVLHDGAGV
ncbi:helix-turn-helix domain-containing protein [Bifidobacterium aerophilum]|uniref:AlbA family DNA-binding domain-containing protein n=1 Tax=Bifidobacterium aerophilum TaxID=1798155 RepID=UPI001EF95A28|nr:ATP-binding protein [Bifidobacterium aerophilum]